MVCDNPNTDYWGGTNRCCGFRTMFIVLMVISVTAMVASFSVLITDYAGDGLWDSPDSITKRTVAAGTGAVGTLSGISAGIPFWGTDGDNISDNRRMGVYTLLHVGIFGMILIASFVQFAIPRSTCAIILGIGAAIYTGGMVLAALGFRDMWFGTKFNYLDDGGKIGMLNELESELDDLNLAKTGGPSANEKDGTDEDIIFKKTPNTNDVDVEMVLLGNRQTKTTTEEKAPVHVVDKVQKEKILSRANQIEYLVARHLEKVNRKNSPGLREEFEKFEREYRNKPSKQGYADLKTTDGKFSTVPCKNLETNKKGECGDCWVATGGNFRKWNVRPTKSGQEKTVSYYLPHDERVEAFNEIRQENDSERQWKRYKARKAELEGCAKALQRVQNDPPKTKFKFNTEGIAKKLRCISKLLEDLKYQPINSVTRRLGRGEEYKSQTVAGGRLDYEVIHDMLHSAEHERGLKHHEDLHVSP